MFSVPELKSQTVELLRDRGYERREEAFELSSGGWSHDYVDCRRALCRGEGLDLASRAIAAHAADLGASFEVVGGLTMGADPLAHGIAMVTGCEWFSVRKEAKGHGRQQLIEGAVVGPGVKVLLVEDVVTTGGSILRALDAVAEVGGEVALAAPLLDRGDVASAYFEARGVRYFPLTTYRDLGIKPIAPSG